MLVRLTRPLFYNGLLYDSNRVVLLPDEVAKKLINGNNAISKAAEEAAAKATEEAAVKAVEEAK